ncbi:heat stress transcription factor A-7a-like [Nicotiana tomentosiformis]|uniref:heat stress transcription factor A-7a-like n=1 Tax=Nicotiana tomentosiformis TaxID=4098 RepID=UPI00051BEEAC|nr:heat stress transcription factor A-7a-like isoform X1 [Nicotiana tomentosiformis]XP_033516269.1 heat stress transcription factor A-7a-like isoform X2 [Nicotiana tomentosiformis]
MLCFIFMHDQFFHLLPYSLKRFQRKTISYCTNQKMENNNQENAENGAAIGSEGRRGGGVGGRRRLTALRGVSPPPFLLKTFEMLEDPETDPFIHWTSNKTTFLITDTNKFAIEVLPKYFKHSNLSSFIYQLNNYGFRKVCSYKSEYANPWFRAGKKHWLKNIKSRIQLSKATKPQQGSHSPCVDPMKDNLEEELEKLRNDNISLKIELQKLKDRQENMRALFPTLKGCRKDTEISNILKLFLEKSKVRGDSSSNDTRKRPQTVESPDRVANFVQDGIGQTSNSAGGSVSSNEQQKEEATAKNDKNREFWEKLLEDDSESQNEGAESEQALNRSKARAEIEEMVESKIAMEGEALIAKAAAGLDEEMETYLQLWT